MKMPWTIALICTLLSFSTASAFAQDAPRISQETADKMKNAKIKKKPVVKPVWRRAGACHTININQPQDESYLARCNKNTIRHADVIVNCGSRLGEWGWRQVGQGLRVPVYKAKRFECSVKNSNKRYRIGYDAGQNSKFGGHRAADYVCGCYTPPGGSECDGNLCTGRMQASLSPRDGGVFVASSAGVARFITAWGAVSTWGDWLDERVVTASSALATSLGA